MQTLVTRMLTTLSLILLLIVAAVAVRVHSWSTERSLVQWTMLPQLISLSSQTTSSGPRLSLASEFADYQIPELALEAPVRRVAAVRKTRPLPRVEFQRVEKQINILDEVFAPVSEESAPAGEWRELQGSTKVPEFDTIHASAVAAAEIEASNLIALADGLVLPEEHIVAKVEEKQAPTPVTDTVSVIQAKNSVPEQDPEFFEYESEAQEAKALPEAVAQQAETVTPAPAAEYSLPGDIRPLDTKAVSTQKMLPEPNEPLLAYNYTAPAPVKQLPKAGALPKPHKPVTTQPKPEPEQQQGFVSTQIAQAVIAPLSVSSRISKLAHFELRAQDDGNTTLQDHGTGKIEIKENVSGEAGSRSFTLLASNHVPTHVDVPLAAGRVDLEVPVLERDFVGKYFVQPGVRPLGYLLVELDDETETVSVDGLKPRETHLDSDFKATKGNDHRYVLFAGVEVGNRLVTATRSDGKKAFRILHVHEEEVTFDPNLYGGQGSLTLTLNEEDMLSRSHRSLVMAGEQLSMTFSGEKAQKLSPNVYRLRASPLLLGSRHYLTLTHQSEEIFLGVEKSGEVDVPSEALIREVIRKFDLQGNAQACLIQVNLDRPAKRYDVLAESHGQAHVSYGLVLDEDGQFYESVGEKSRKLFIMSENQGGEDISRNAKINVRIEYQDGSKRTFSTFCSANTYLVEQL